MKTPNKTDRAELVEAREVLAGDAFHGWAVNLESEGWTVRTVCSARSAAIEIKAAYKAMGWNASNLTRFGPGDYGFQVTEKRPAIDGPRAIHPRAVFGQIIHVRVTS